MWWMFLGVVALSVLTSVVFLWSALNAPKHGWKATSKETKTVTKFNGAFYYNVEE